MTAIISNLVERFESGRLSRRELIRGLAMLVAAGGPAARALGQGAAPPASLPATGIDHVSVLVSDLQRSTHFYQSLFGMTVLSEDKDHSIVRLGYKRATNPCGGARGIVSLRKEAPYGTVDHFGIGVENFNKQSVTQTLQQHGVTPQENWQYGFFVKDPDGVNVQFV
jgi:catechol 2,3-dioxygenase-like lactoylglutathione lyase family enzyme